MTALKLNYGLVQVSLLQNSAVIVQLVVIYCVLQQM